MLAQSHPSVSPQLLLTCGLPCTLTQASLLPSAYACLDADEGSNISFTYSAFLSRVCLPRWTLSPVGPRSVCLLSLIYSGAGAAADARVLGMDGFKLAPVVCCAPHEELGGGDSARASLKGKGTWSHSDCPEEGGTC